MGWKAALSRPLAKWIMRGIYRKAMKGAHWQEVTFRELIDDAAHTAFGNDHGFSEIRTHRDFVERVPVRTYEDLVPYIERAKDGEENVLWPGKPIYFCKTSGTTAGTKYIPLTSDSMPNHIGSARNALFAYIADTGRADFIDGKMIFLQGSPKLDKLPSGIPFGRLSGIVANHVPAYLQNNRMPTFATNCIEDWETKVNAIADETAVEPMSLISGIPSWVQMYFELLLKKTGKKTISEVFPSLSLFVYGGVNFDPYRARFHALIGKDIPSIELYPASEGFIAWQDSQSEEGLLLNVHSGLFFEFIPVEEYFHDNPTRLTLGEVKTGIQYALVLSSNAGLWAYSIGDTVKFVSLSPPRIKVTGRIKHFTSAFGEHVIAEEVDAAMTKACKATGAGISEFHVAPMVHPTEGLPYHEWFVEFEQLPRSMEEFIRLLDEELAAQNIYYRDLIKGHVLRTLVLRPVEKGSFNAYMKSQGKLGGQNKVPRLANDRKIADALSKV
jgi:hypothetical protein